MGQIDDMVIDYYKIKNPEDFNIRTFLEKHLEPQKKAEVCQHLNWESYPMPFCRDCNRFLVEPVEPQQEDKKIGRLEDRINLAQNSWEIWTAIWELVDFILKNR